MHMLTLTPNAACYGVMLVSVLSLGSFNVARHTHIRWLKHHLSFVAANAVIKGLMVLFGLLLIPMQSLFAGSLAKESFSVGLGGCLGVLTILFEIHAVRWENRRCLRMKKMQSRSPVGDLQPVETVRSTLCLTSSSAVRAKGIGQIRKRYLQYAAQPDLLHYAFFSVVLVAVFEEFLFRGFLISIALWLNHPRWCLLMIAGSQCAFAFSHVSDSWTAFFRKLPLALLSSGCFLLTGSLSGPIIMHVVFNLYAFFKRKNTMQVMLGQAQSGERWADVD